MEIREMNVWLNPEEINKFEAFLRPLKLEKDGTLNKFVVRLVTEPGKIYKVYDTKLIQLAEGSIKYYVFDLDE